MVLGPPFEGSNRCLPSSHETDALSTLSEIVGRRTGGEQEWSARGRSATRVSGAAEPWQAASTVRARGEKGRPGAISARAAHSGHRNTLLLGHGMQWMNREQDGEGAMDPRRAGDG